MVMLKSSIRKYRWLLSSLIVVCISAVIVMLWGKGQVRASSSITEEVKRSAEIMMEQLIEPEIPPLEEPCVYLPHAVNNSQNKYGHFPYPEAFTRDLVHGGNGKLLHTSAAAQFRKMVTAARAEGVSLVLISGFRNYESQRYLFYDIARIRGESLEMRARVVAPPGYSEHHTGYAVDIGDGRAPQHNLRESFEKTAAFRWLATNASNYGFELSFPRNNYQGINYEPWHWRWVGDGQSQQIFKAAKC